MSTNNQTSQNGVSDLSPNCLILFGLGFILFNGLNCYTSSFMKLLSGVFQCPFFVFFFSLLLLNNSLFKFQSQVVVFSSFL